MGRQKKNELDAILEQLKRSYATDVDNELEDSLLEAEQTEEDAELAQVLEKIFASGSHKEEDNDEDVNLEFDQAASQEDSHDEIEDIEADSTEDGIEGVGEESNETEVESDDTVETETSSGELINASNAVPIELHYNDDNAEEEEKVDDVLNMMLHHHAITESDESVTEPEDEEIPVTDELSKTEEHSSLLEIFTQDYPIDEDAEEIIDADQIVGFENESDVDLLDIIDSTDDHSASDELSDDNVDAEFGTQGAFEFDDNEDTSDAIICSENLDDSAEGSLCIDECEGESTEIEENSPEVKTLILDAQNYTVDILQHPLSDMSFFKPQDDINFSVYAQTEPEDEEQDVPVEDSSASKSKADVSDNDVSLLMKFGYSGEIASSVGNEHAQAVVVEKNNEYNPPKHKIAHGFTGKEFFDNSQIEAITKKFKSDKTRLLILSIVMSVISMAMLTGDILALLSDNVNNYLSLIFFESLFVLAIIIMLAKRLYSGILGIIRFEANAYSMLSVILFECLLYCSAMEIIYVISPALVVSNVYIAMGGYVSLYTAFTVWSEYFDCCREHNTFNIVSDGDVHCVLEKKSGESISLNRKRHKHTDIIYSVKRSHFVSGFFRRMHNRSISPVNIVLVVGVIPFVAIVVGIMSAMMRNSVVLGVNAAGYVLFAAIPLSSVFVPSVIEFINSIKLSRKHCAFIGMGSVDEYSSIDSLSFSDYDAVEITTLTEINPNKNGDNPKKWVNIAANVFEALGGPLSKTVKTNRVDEPNISHDSTINSVSENGIDLYFDSSMNVLIGDRQYMLAHNIRVKTDTNLSTAVKGVDRTVVYMAFDGIPQIGFIITSKIKRSFLETVELLEKNKIKIIVNSYEPEINDYYFEVNGIENTLSVHKPENYESSEPSAILDSGVIASTPHELCSTVIYGQTIINDRRKAKKASIIQTVIGFVVAGFLVAISCLAPSNDVIAVIQSNTLFIFYITAVLGLIPNIVQIVKIIKRKSSSIQGK